MGLTKPADNNNNQNPEGSVPDPDIELVNTGIADMSLSSDVVTHDYAQPNYDATYAHSKPDTDLGKFLGRLVKIGEYTWAPTSPDATILEVYSSWLSNVTVSSKIVGYKYFRAKPVLHFVVNGFSWYYGKLLIATDLDPGYDGASIGPFDPDTQYNINAVTDKAGAYQAPHVSIDPSMSQTYTLELPFYSANEWYEVTTEDPGRVPKISLRAFPFNPLASANDVAAGNVSIAIYVEMRYLELSVPSWPLDLGGFQNQSGNKKAISKPKDSSDKGPSNSPPKESHKDGILSGPLTSVLNVTKTIHDFGGEAIPVVGPFLGPFNAIGSKAADALRIFGFASPLNLDSEKAFRQDNTFNFGGNFRDNSIRMTNDVKNNLAIDSAAATVGENDDMQVSSIVSRSGLVHQFAWTDQGVNSPAEFATINVNPMQGFDLESNRDHRMTPMAHITSMHEYWSGSIVYTIEVVCSQFHRGTLGISYLPFRSLGPATLSFDELPNQYQTVIMDITETKSIEFAVPYVDLEPVQPVVTSSLGQLIINNGKLVIYEINPLKSSAAANNVGINVYARAGDDFTLYRPTLIHYRPNELELEIKDDPDPYTPPQQAMATVFEETNPLFNVDPVNTQSQGIHDTDHHEEEESSEVPERTAQITSVDRSLIYFGEQTLTLKTLMSKPCLTSRVVTTPATYNWQQYELPILPYNVYSAVNNATYTSYLSILMHSYLSYRGGLRYKINTVISSGPTPIEYFASDISSSMKYCAFAPPSGNILEPTPTASIGLDQLRFNSGQVLVRDWTSPLEVEIPYINNFRFFNPRKMHNPQVAETEFSKPTMPHVVGRWDFATGQTLYDYVYTCGADDTSLHGYFMAPVAKYPA